MEIKEYEVTITLEEYRNLLNSEFMYSDIMVYFFEIIEQAKLDYYREDLDINVSIKPLIKKYCKSQYLRRLNKLKEELANTCKEAKNNE